VLTTRQAYPPPDIPEHLIVIGSGVTGVEFTHMFSALGSQVSLIVSRQQVLPTKDPEVAAVLENEFIRRGVKLLKGARAVCHGDRAGNPSSRATTTEGSGSATSAIHSTWPPATWRRRASSTSALISGSRRAIEPADSTRPSTRR